MNTPMLARNRALLYVAAAAVAASAALAQPPQANYDEDKVGTYTLPDPLLLPDGTRVRSADIWNKKQRPRVLELFQTEVYGRSPAKPKGLRFELSSLERNALGGKATRKQVTIFFAGKDGPKADMLIYLPNDAQKPVPMFLGLNFPGNAAVHEDPGIRLGDVWARQEGTRDLLKQAGTEQMRGRAATAWQVEKILARGYGLATIYYCDIEPDFDGGLPYGVRPVFFKKGQSSAAPGEWGAIGAWAWGLSRTLDYMETDRDIDAKRVAVMGHSRLGKTALWAAAQDTRFALAISNNSGEGGASLSRRNYGERIKDLNTRFPHWFTENYRKYNDRENESPVDQHMLIALIAPRPVYVASAEKDRWADPKGEFLSVYHAGPVYELFGRKGLGTDRMPGLHQPIMHDVGYHIRAGEHAVLEYDWEQYLNFADLHLRSKR